MSWLDKMGKKALDAIDSAARVAEQVKERVDPLLDRTPLANVLRRDKPADLVVPTPEQNVSPFAPPPADEPEAPLARPDLPAQVFGAGTDPWTGRALQLLADRDIEHEFVDLESEAGGKLESRLIRETNATHPPFIFVRGEYVGGYNALDEIDRLGQLEELVKPPEERNKSRLRIAIPKRSADEPPPGESR